MSEITCLGVVGGGFMGSGIAESAARAGLSVVIHEPEQAPLDRSRARIEESVRRAAQRGKLSEDEAAEMLGRITWSTELEALTAADAVVEAIIEDARAKGSLFKKLDQLLPDAIFLASNTSSIPIAEIAAWTRRPERVIGVHFFSPVPVMSLVEIVRAIDTSDATVAAADALAATLQKHPVHTPDRAGFVVNMLLVPYLMAAIRMYEDGFATREDIDEGMKRGCGHPMGPLTLCDFIGLDVMYAIGESLYEEFKRPDFAPPPLLKRMVVSGHFGRKSGRGFYEYEPEPAKVAAPA
ncbi:3-hydroxybutyryl-CoA dehydrogenase [Paraconexibacter antarcticus]|uniref:3-hydroxybutyryl-CoA dehydrogenase n=1 Tax=Paraconexibacter antarcticus TaxID=2949664 RepID=A0ABY5DWX8_9ACTN|nr:3-hydroxybutyryl-CoA dehydrogenase [Paraconexibacter antarcticus]UTI65444.1 3-hydroxybutyryl-CoA dehydrogenase [Paraconexibacter antarcticus]